MIGIGVVVNPRSKYFRHHPEAPDALRRVIGGRGLVIESDSPDALVDIARRFAAAGVGIVGICGGDGTAGVTVDALRQVYGEADVPPIALLRGGTMNTVANALGVRRGRPATNLRRLLDRTRHGVVPPCATPMTISVAGVSTFLFGTGVFRSFLAEYYASAGGDPSAWTAVATITRAAASAFAQSSLIKRLTEPLEAELEIDGEHVGVQPYMAICAGTVAEVGLGFKAFYMADQYQDAFHLLTIHGGSSDVVRDLWRVWLGQPLRAVSGQNRVARRVVIRAVGDQVPYMRDGDLHVHDGPLELKAGAVIRVIV